MKENLGVNRDETFISVYSWWYMGLNAPRSTSVFVCFQLQGVAKLPFFALCCEPKFYKSQFQLLCCSSEMEKSKWSN